MDLLLALNAGLPGLCTIHGNSARDALHKLTLLPLLAGPNIAAQFIVPTVASTIDLIVQLELASDGRRRVTEIAAVSGRVEGNVIECGPVFERRSGDLVRVGGLPAAKARLRSLAVAEAPAVAVGPGSV